MSVGSRPITSTRFSPVIANLLTGSAGPPFYCAPTLGRPPIDSLVPSRKSSRSLQNERAQIEHARRVGPRGDDVRRAVAVYITEREPIDRTLLVSETDDRKPAACSIIDESRSRRLAIPQDRVHTTVAIEVGDRNRIHGLGYLADRNRSLETRTTPIEIDRGA